MNKQQTLDAIDKAVEQAKGQLGAYVSHPGQCLDTVLAAWDAVRSNIEPNVSNTGWTSMTNKAGWLEGAVQSLRDTQGWAPKPGDDYEKKDRLAYAITCLQEMRSVIVRDMADK